MKLDTLDDVTRFNAHQRQALLGMVAEASPELRTWRPAAEKWSLLENLEHVALYRQYFVPIFEELTSKAERATPETVRHVDALPALATTGIDAAAKFQAPEPMVPRGLSHEESLALMDQTQARLLACVEQFPGLDTDRAVHRHRAGVELNLAQLWHFVGLHDYRHIQQMRALLAARESGAQA